MKIDKSVLTLISEVVRFYPSPDNMQCFFLKAQDEHLEIHYDHKKGQHAINFNEFANAITLGHLLCYLEQTSFHFKLGIEVKYEIRTLNFSSNQKICEVHFQDSITKPSVSIQTLRKRHVDRRALPGQLTEEEWKKIAKMQDAKFQFHIDTNQDKALVRYLSFMDSLIYFWPTAAKDLLKLINHPKENKKIGLELNNLGVTLIERFIVSLMKRFLFLIPICFNSITALFFKFNMRRLHKNSHAHIVFSLDQSSPFEERINYSKKICMVWLKLTEMGATIQPHSFATIFASSTLKEDEERLNSQAKFNFSQMKKKTDFLKEKYSFPQGHDAFWIFRVGKSRSPLQKSQRTRRIDVEDFLKYDDQATLEASSA